MRCASRAGYNRSAMHRDVLWSALACSSAIALHGCARTPEPIGTPSDAPRSVDARVGNGDAPGGGMDAAVVRLPTWELQDIQPQSPRFQETYGLTTFGAKVVVVTLSEGF